MSLVQTYGKELVALLVPLIAWSLSTFFRSKAKLYVSNPHTFTFLVQQPLLNAEGQQISPTQTVHTTSLVVWNGGRETATKIELVFNWKPLCVNFWPPRSFEEHVEPDRRFVIIFESLAPNESIGCELMSLNAELPRLLTIRSEQCVATFVPMYPQPIVAPWKRRVDVFLALLGIGVMIYGLLALLQWLVLAASRIAGAR